MFNPIFFGGGAFKYVKKINKITKCLLIYTVATSFKAGRKMERLLIEKKETPEWIMKANNKNWEINLHNLKNKKKKWQKRKKKVVWIINERRMYTHTQHAHV